jgi:uncharacterized LabA/DUF88 family protein
LLLSLTLTPTLTLPLLTIWCKLRAQLLPCGCYNASAWEEKASLTGGFFISKDRKNVSATATEKRTAIYIDGYNLYYGRIRGTAFKWLDVVSLFESIVKQQDPASKVQSVNFFTAPALANFATHGQKSTIAQQDYHRALGLVHSERFRIIKGKHSVNHKGVPMPTFVDDKPYDRAVVSRVWKLEEKQTDVNLALSIYRDAAKGLVDQVVIVTNDSDAEPAMKAVREDFPAITVGSIMPVRPPADGVPRRISISLENVAHWTRRHILDDELAKHQLPDQLPTKKRPIKKPPHW